MNLRIIFYLSKIWKSDRKIKFWNWFVPNWVSLIFRGKNCSNNTQREFLQIFIWNLKSETIMMSNKKIFTRKIRSFFSFFHFNFIQRKTKQFLEKLFEFLFDIRFFQIWVENIKNIFTKKRRKFHTTLVLQVRRSERKKQKIFRLTSAG